jgi:hypothetical protein
MKTYELKIDENQRKALLEAMHVMNQEWGLSEDERDLDQMLENLHTDVLNDLTT